MINGIIMKNPDLSSILEECICELQRGATLDEVLAEYPSVASELRPLLETAVGMKYNQARLVVPVDAQARSRYDFLSMAAARPESRSLFHLHLRLATTLIIVVALVGGILSTGLVSASALPGDTLYPVKLTIEQIQLSVAASAQQRLALQDQFDQVRAQEVNQLQGANRNVTVTFSGIPAKMNGDWSVAGIKLDVSQQDSQELENMQNYVVQVTGETQGSTVKVAQVQPQMVTISGMIEAIQQNYWVISGVQVSVNSETAGDSAPGIGQQVNITAQRQNDGRLVAMQVEFQNPVVPTQVKNGDEGGTISTPDRESNPTGSGTGETHGGSSGEPGISPTPDQATREGEGDHSPTVTPEPKIKRTEGESGTQQPDNSEQHRPTPTPNPSRSITPRPDHSGGG
jgi:hypothetical protein